MATSNIFHNVILNEPKQVEAFVNAMEASLADPYTVPHTPLSELIADKNEIIRLHELRQRNRNDN